MNHNITIGNPVSFDCEDGPKSGIVAELQSNIATVYVPGTMNGKPWAIPVVELTLSKGAQ
jgi:hypothetical protein